MAPSNERQTRTLSEPLVHPLRKRLASKFPRPLSRSCGYPYCDQRLTVGLFESGTGFRAAEYCEDHQDAANRHRKRLRAAIAEIEALICSEERLPRAPRGSPEGGLNKAELERWRRRLQWELDGIPQ